MSKWKKVKTTISQNLVWETIKSLGIWLVFNGGVFLVLDETTKYISNLNSPIVFWGIILIISILSLLGVFYYIKNSPKFPRIYSDFHVLEKEISHIVLSENACVYTRRYKLKANRDGLAQYSDKFLWTGERFEISSDDNLHTVRMSKKVNVFDTFIVELDRSYNKGETVEIKVKWMLYGKSQPFISTQIEEPTDLLKLNVNFDTKVKVDRVIFQETYVPAAKRILNHEELELSNNSISKSVECPRLLYLYEVSWKIKNII